MATTLSMYEGILEITGKGFGFLPSPAGHYLPKPGDPYVPGKLIQKFGLREGVQTGRSARKRRPR